MELYNRIKEVVNENRGVLLMGMLLLCFITDSLNVLFKGNAFVESLYYVRLSAYSRGIVLFLIALLFFWEKVKNWYFWLGMLLFIILFYVGVDFTNSSWFIVLRIL